MLLGEIPSVRSVTGDSYSAVNVPGGKFKFKILSSLVLATSAGKSMSKERQEDGLAVW